MVTSPSIYDDAEKFRFIGILAYPKRRRVMFSKNYYIGLIIRKKRSLLLICSQILILIEHILPIN